MGDIKYTGSLASKNTMGDRCRTLKIGFQIIWNCGDTKSANDYTVCRFSMGPACYGTSDVVTINTDNVQYGTLCPNSWRLDVHISRRVSAHYSQVVSPACTERYHEIDIST